MKNCFFKIFFNFFFSDINSFYQTVDLNVFFQSLFSFRTFLTKFSMKTLALTLLFQCNFLLVVGVDNLIWQFYLYFYRILSKWCWINNKVFSLQHNFSLYTNIPWDQSNKLYSGRVNCYILIKYEEELYIF